MKTSANSPTRFGTAGPRCIVRRTLAYVLIGLLLAGTAGPAYSLEPPYGYPDAGSGYVSNEDVARRFFDELHTNGDLAVAGQIVAADAMFHTPDGEMRGPEGVSGLVTVLRAAFTDAQFPIEELVVNGDTVVARWTMTGTHNGEFQGIAASGAKVSMSGIAILHLRDGMIVEDWVQYDRLGLLQQIGGLPAPSAGPAYDPPSCDSPLACQTAY